MAFTLFNPRQKEPSSGEYAPDETPLGPRTYPRIGNAGRTNGLPSKTTMERAIGIGGHHEPKSVDWRELWRTKKWWILAGTSVVVIALLAVAVVIGRRGAGNLAEQVRLTIGGPDRVALGSDVAYDIQVSNSSGTTLANPQLLVIYPDGFSFTSSEPAASNQQGTEFAPETIAPGAGYSVRVQGRLTGGVSTEQLFIARLTFSPGEEPARLQVESTFTTTIETSAFTFGVEAADTSLPGNEVTFAIELQSNATDPLEALQVRATYPGGFDVTTLEPATSSGDNVWSIDSLGIGQKFTISLAGRLGGSPEEVKRFVFQAGLLDADGNFLKQSEVEKIIKLTTPSVTVSQTVDGKTELAVDSESDLTYTVGFENTGPSGLTNLVLDVGFTPGTWDTSTLRPGNGGVLKPGNLIRWDGVTVPALRALEAGSKGEVTFEVRPFQQPTVDDASDKNFATTSTPTIKIGAGSVNGNPVTVKYKANITAGASTTVVAGPNPPTIGQETTYEVTWTLSTLYNDLSGARFVGSVPAGATFVPGSGHVSVGEDLSFNPANGQLLWNIGKVPANVGKLTSDFRATFRIKVTPQVNQVGQALTLVTQQQFTARDEWTAEDRATQIPDVNSGEVE